MDSDQDCDTPVLNKNRGRFYSHQVGDEHLKVNKLLKMNQMGEVNKINENGEFDISKYIDKNVCDDPSQLLSGIAEMFVNTDNSLSYATNPDKGMCISIAP
jgi:hypothetical protein